MATDRQLGARGEGRLELDGKTYVILYTNRALADAERELRKPILRILRDVQNDDLSITEIVQLLAVGLECARRENKSQAGGYDINDAWLLMDRLGLITVIGAVASALAAVTAYVPSEGESPPA